MQQGVRASAHSLTWLNLLGQVAFKGTRALLKNEWVISHEG